MSRNMCKLRHKVRNDQNLPNESPNFRNFFCLDNFMDNLVHFFTSLRQHYHFFFIFFFCFSTLKSRMSRNMCIWHHKLCNVKMGVGLTFTWSNDAGSIDKKWIHLLRWNCVAKLKFCYAIQYKHHSIAVIYSIAVISVELLQWSKG